jgi:hypothetical protein
MTMAMYVVQRSTDGGRTWEYERHSNGMPLMFAAKRVACEHSYALNKLEKFSASPIKYRVILVRD